MTATLPAAPAGGERRVYNDAERALIQSGRVSTAKERWQHRYRVATPEQRLAMTRSHLQ